ncbi:MAG TPA: hypothetical protein VHR41_11405 [Gemmatimonadales bacterium]|jgi:hypothetical protein|nr:hypothetical protein [Gemmatimonadales bacterium]
MADLTPARLDRAALERIIQRAAELQTAARDIGESLTPDEVLSLGKEVGIPDRYLQQALLEERTRVVVPEPRGPWARVAGPAQVSTQRVVPGSPEQVERALVQWMEQNEIFCIQRQQPGRITWEPMSGMAAAMRRSAAAFGSGKRSFMLSRADTVSATLLPLEPGRTHVTLQAEARRARAEYAGGGAAVAGAGLGSAALMMVLGAFLPVALLPVPIALGLGYVTARRYGPALQRIQLGLERALDHLEHGEARANPQFPPRATGLLGLIADEVRKSLR